MKEALKLALEALEHINDRFDLESVAQDATTAITAIKGALAQPEPVEDVVAYHSDGTRTVRIAPKRPWVRLTDEQKYKLIKDHLGLEQRRDDTVIDRRTGRFTDSARYFALIDAAFEIAHGIKENT